MGLTKIYALFFAILIPLNFTTAGIITDLDENGRDIGYYRGFSIKEENRVRYLVMGKCFEDRIVPKTLTLKNCNQQIKRIELNSALEQMQSGLSTQLFIEILKRQRANPKDTSAFLKSNIKGMVANEAAKENSLLADILEKVDNEDSAREIASEPSDPNLTGYIDLLEEIADPSNAPHLVLVSNKAADDKKYRHALKLAQAFSDGFYQDIGFACRVEDKKFVENKNGGCFFKTSGLTYSAPLYVNDYANSGVWLDREIARWRCESLTAGGHRDWRLPTREELTTAKPVSEFIGFDPFHYYWTSEISLGEIRDPKIYYLGEQTRSSRTENVLIGFKTSDIRQLFSYARNFSSRPIFAPRTDAVVDTNRVLSALFTVEEKMFHLIRPARGTHFDVKRYRLLGATGVLSYDQVRRITEPGYVSQNTRDVFGTGDVIVSQPKVETWKSSESALGTYSQRVNPLDYVHYELPKEVNRDEIALVCVRK